MPNIAIIGVGGGGSRILSEGLDKILTHINVDRYHCLATAIHATTDDPLVYVVDTSSDPVRRGFFDNIPEPHRLSLSSSIRGMSRGAGGRPGRAKKAILNDDVVENLAQNLYKPIADAEPAIVVIIHTADGGTGGGLTPEILFQLGYALPLSTIFWVFTVLPRRNRLALQGPRAVALNLGRLLEVSMLVSNRDFSNIPYNGRDAIQNAIERSTADESYDFLNSRIAIFPLSNHHFSQCWTGHSRRQIREEVLNPFPIELLSQALYPFLKYTVASEDEQVWMQRNWPLGPIDIPDIMAGLTAERPVVIPHLWIDPPAWDDDETNRVLENIDQGRIDLDEIETQKNDTGDTGENGENGDGDDSFGLFTFTGTSARLFKFKATSMYCIPIYPDGSEYFDEYGDFVSDVWFPELSGMMNYISGHRGLTTGVVTHSANLKPQPIPRPPDGRELGFENGLLVTLLFGAVPLDFPIWLESTRDILDQYQTEDFWEMERYDASNWLRLLGSYIGWTDWPDKKYMDIDDTMDNGGARNSTTHPSPKARPQKRSHQTKAARKRSRTRRTRTRTRTRTRSVKQPRKRRRTKSI